jgi:hypothetical protein
LRAAFLSAALVEAGETDRGDFSTAARVAIFHRLQISPEV